jgi:EAL domain-containing protein (putative c-di-GMP-specific phosphodiesterase class I)
MARGLDIEVVAEFVTDLETADLCRELGVDAIQGSFVGPTISLEEALGIS